MSRERDWKIVNTRMLTDADYSDMVNPYVRAEEEAFKRGHTQGLLSGLWLALCGLVAVGLLLVALVAQAAEIVRFRLTAMPIRASAVDARITVCQQYPEVSRKWQCYALREGK